MGRKTIMQRDMIWIKIRLATESVISILEDQEKGQLEIEVLEVCLMAPWISALEAMDLIVQEKWGSLMQDLNQKFQILQVVLKILKIGWNMNQIQNMNLVLKN